jgi:hypothetical protein
MPLLLLLLASALQAPPPIGFLGFTPGMPVRQAAALIKTARGTLTCRGASDPRMAECTGILPFPGLDRPLEVLISSINDSAAVIVFSGHPGDEVARTWTVNLTRSLGEPRLSLRQPGAQVIREWVRRGRMIRLVQRNPGNGRETSITLTHGPLLDGLPQPKTRAPD